MQSVNVLRQQVKVVVSLDNDEKEIRDYPVEQLKFKPRKRKEKNKEKASAEEKELKQLEEAGAPGLPIGKAAAAQAAEEYAGTLELDSVTWEVDAELDEVPAHYEVELRTAWGNFEYKVDAYTGKVLKGTQGIAGKLQISAPASSVLISESKARAIALSDAGVTESSALGLKVKLDWEDGTQVYEVEFRANGIEYEYEIDAAGTVRSAERDGGGSKTTSNTSTAYIGEAAAKAAALSHAGVE